MEKKVQIVMDYGHVNWVIGGLFREMFESSPELFIQPIKISPLRSRHVIFSVIYVIRLKIRKTPILFTSITPLQNFTKYSKLNSNFKAIVFTHYAGELPENIKKLLNSIDLIFCLSSKERERLIRSGVKTSIYVVVGAINSNRFREVSVGGTKIAWVGTPVSRKNPEIFLNFVEETPELEFLLLGRGWSQSGLMAKVNSLKNLEYKEINNALTSSDFTGCSHYLMMSKWEGGPMPLLESLAAGLIPICTDVGFCRELMAQVGYEKQILEFPIAFSSIKKLLKKKYSLVHRQEVSVKVKYYSFELLGYQIYTKIWDRKSV